MWALAPGQSCEAMQLGKYAMQYADMCQAWSGAWRDQAYMCEDGIGMYMRVCQCLRLHASAETTTHQNVLSHVSRKSLWSNREGGASD